MIENNTDRKHRFYQSALWRNTRKYYKMYHPLCDCCIVVNKVSPTKEIHHLIPFDDQVDEDKKLLLLGDEDNLISLCVDCHQRIHKDFASLNTKQQELIINKERLVKKKYDNKRMQLVYDSMHTLQEHKDNHRDETNNIMKMFNRKDKQDKTLFN